MIPESLIPRLNFDLIPHIPVATIISCVSLAVPFRLMRHDLEFGIQIDSHPTPLDHFYSEYGVISPCNSLRHTLLQ